MAWFKNHKSFIFLGLIILFLGGGAILFFYDLPLQRWWYQKGIKFLGKEFESIQVEGRDSDDPQLIQPRQFRVTDVTKTRVRLEWRTSQPTLGFVYLGSNKQEVEMKYTPIDGLSPHQYHEIVVTNLMPGRRYYVVVSSNGRRYGYQGEPLEFMTSF